MRIQWLLAATIALSCDARAMQANTPEGALMELATAEKPEVIVRHLPDPIQKQIDHLPKPQKQQVMEKLLEMKSAQFNGCKLRPAADAEAEAWELFDCNGERLNGKVKLATAFMSGLDALLPLQFEGGDGAQNFIVTMHLEEHEWRIVDFGPWEKADTGLRKLLHEPTVMEENEETARQTLRLLAGNLNNYASRFPLTGYPERLSLLTAPRSSANPFVNGNGAMLDKSYAADPVVKTVMNSATCLRPAAMERAGESS